MKKHSFFLLFAVSAGMKMKKYLKKENQLKYFKFLIHFKIYNYFKNMAEENISQEFRLKNIVETEDYLTEEIN